METETPEHAPDHRELYLLIAGVIAGVLLGPAVFGRLWQQGYDAAFPSVEQAQLRLLQSDADHARLRQLLTQSSATDTAIAELEQRYLAPRAERQAALQHALRSRGRMTTLILAIAIVLIVEAVIAGARPEPRRRLARARFALMAVWIALLLARPEMLSSVSLPFLVILAVLVFVAAWAPGHRASRSAESD